MYHSRISALEVLSLEFYKTARIIDICSIQFKEIFTYTETSFFSQRGGSIN